MINVSDEIVSFINDHETFYVLGHVEPDGDSVGACLALKSFLTRNNKTVHLLASGDFSRIEIVKYKEHFNFNIEDSWNLTDGKSGVILVDSSTPDRMGPYEDRLAKLPLLVIDHHVPDEDFGTVRYIDTSAPAVTLLVQKVIEKISNEVTLSEANHLFLGLATDTGFFRFLDENSQQTFEHTSRLVSAGASPREIHGTINNTKTFKNRVWLGKMLSRLEPHFNNRFIIGYETRKDRQQFTDQDRNTAELYASMLAVDSCEAIAFLKEKEDGRITVSLRSKNYLDVAFIARELGGGGHVRASGFALKGSIQSIKSMILELVEEKL